MPNLLYPSYRNALLGSSNVSMSSDHRTIISDSADYTYSTAHDFLNDVASGARVATSGAMTNPTLGTVSSGTYDADDITYSSVSGDSVEQIILYQHTGTESSSELVMFLDTSITNFPLTPNSGNIVISWHANGIFQIA